jgi:hypothetical protein
MATHDYALLMKFPSNIKCEGLKNIQSDTATQCLSILVLFIISNAFPTVQELHDSASNKKYHSKLFAKMMLHNLI